MSFADEFKTNIQEWAKHADDTTLIYPDQTAVSFADEFKTNIQEWAKQN